MKRILTTLALAATISFTTMAQVNPNDKEYLHPREDGKIERLYTQDFYHFDVETLEKFHQEWEDYTRRHPTDEIGWRNYEQVWRSYMMVRGWPEESSPLRIEWRRRLAESIPNTYTYYYMNPSYENACKAMELLPDDVIGGDVTGLINIMYVNADTVRMVKLLTTLYNRRLISQNMLQYHFNELQGMPENALYIGSNIIPKLVIQYVLGLHRDKVFYCNGRFFDHSYNARFFRSLGIPKPDYDFESEFDHKFIVQYICDYSPRPVCFSAYGMNDGDWLTDSLKARLYNEGLTMRYSATPYDNFAVKRRNINQRYLLEYLLYPFQKPEEWNRNWRWLYHEGELAENYVRLFKDQLPWYKKHDREGYKRLGRLFFRISVGPWITTFRQMADTGEGELAEGKTMQDLEKALKELEDIEKNRIEEFLKDIEETEKKAKEADKNAETPTKQEKK